MCSYACKTRPIQLLLTWLGFCMGWFELIGKMQGTVMQEAISIPPIWGTSASSHSPASIMAVRGGAWWTTMLSVVTSTESSPPAAQPTAYHGLKIFLSQLTSYFVASPWPVAWLRRPCFQARRGHPAEFLPKAPATHSKCCGSFYWKRR